MSEKKPSRYAQFETDSAAAVASNQEQARRQEAFSARVEKANDTAELELYGSNGRSFVDPETGDVIADKNNPITGKIEEIQSNRRYGSTEDERLGEADVYEQSILNNVEDGMPLAQAKLIVDLEMADVQKRGNMIGKHISEGNTYEQASEKVDTLLARLADKRRQMILEGGALTASDYQQLRDGVDLYPASEASDENEPNSPTASLENKDNAVVEETESEVDPTAPAEATGASEGDPEGDETEEVDHKLSDSEIRAKRKLMVQQGVSPLGVGNMSNDEIDRYNLVERNPDQADDEPDPADSADSKNPNITISSDNTGRELALVDNDPAKKGELIDSRDVNNQNVTISRDNTGRELALVKEEDQEPDKLRFRDHLYTKLGIITGSVLGYISGTFNKLANYKPERRDGESDSAYEQRSKRSKVGRGLAAAGLAAVTIAVGKEIYDSVAGQGAEVPTSIPGFDNDNEVPPADLVADHSKTPGFDNDNEVPSADLEATGAGVSGEILNIDQYEYPWNWAVEEFGMGEAMTKLHELSESAKTAGYDVQWHNLTDGNDLNDWISVDGNSDTKHVIEILNQFNK